MPLRYLKWLKKIETKKTKDKKEVEIWFFDYDDTDDALLVEWANHFRNMYCDDAKIDSYRGKNFSKKDYLNQIKFPDISNPPGPSTRAGDFSELLIADFLEYTENYFVPRTRYNKKVNKDLSTPGCDVIAMKIDDADNPSFNDKLLVFEVKADLTSSYSSSKISRLQDAINDSKKDAFRIATSLAAMKERFLDENQLDLSSLIERFQNPLDNAYQKQFGAAAVYSTDYYEKKLIKKTSCKDHSYKENLRLIVVTGKDLMKLCNLIYQRAADEA